MSNTQTLFTMKRTSLLLVLVMQILLVLPSFSQELFIRDVIAKPSEMVSPNAKSGDIQNDYQQERQIIDDYLKQINPNFSTGNLKIIIDSRNVKHFRFDILYNNIIVDGHKLTLHPRSDTTLYVKGMNLFSDSIVTTPSITEEQAIEKLKSENNLITDESILSSELVIYKELRGEPYLCYKIRVIISIREGYDYYISAINSDILKKRTSVTNYVSATGIAELENWGEQLIPTAYNTETSKYFLYDSVAKISTRNLNRSINMTTPYTYDTDNYWSYSEYPESYVNSPNAPLVAHWSARQTYNFFKTTFNRNGYDNNNGNLPLYVNFGDDKSGSNAGWNPYINSISIGSGSNTDSTMVKHFATLDIVAHEYGHAVTSNTANLIYEGESGAINESLSDIWAACVEHYLGGSFYEIWNEGNHMDSVFRCMSDPNSKYDPDTYGGTYWKDPSDLSDDKGGVHTNSGIMNYWFYLLVQGGSGINDNNESYNIQSIGFQKAQHIVYDALTEHLDEESDFADAREATILATTDLYGENSNEHKQVANAWHAVGVGAPYVGNILGDYGVCDNGAYNMSYFHSATSITWSVDSFTNAMNQQRPKLNIESGQNTGSITIERALTGLAHQDGTLYYYNGPVTLTATVSYGNETYIREKTLFVNTPLPDIQYTTRQVSNVSMNKIYKFYVDNVATNYLNWRIEANGNVYTASAQNYIEISLPTTRQYDVIVSVTDNGGCSDSNYKTRTLNGVSIVTPILSHENPVTSNSVFYLKKTTDEPNEGAIYNIEIWNEYGLVRSERYEDSPEFMVSTEGLMSGVYFIQIYRNGEFLGTQKLIVK